MVELKPCPYCGGDVKTEYSRLSKWWIGCTNDNCPVQPYAEWFSAEEEAIEAWNRRNGFEAPDGYIVLPATKLDKPKPVISNTDNGVEAKYDLSEVIRQYSKYLADKADYEILTKSLNRIGWFKERTCTNTPLGDNWDDKSPVFECSECGWDNFTMSDELPRLEINYCPNCGAKVVGD